jgi:hypothetical protein
VNEITGLKVNAAGEVAEVAPLDPDLTTFKPGPIDLREEGERTQFVEGRRLERQGAADREECGDPAGLFA